MLQLDPQTTALVLIDLQEGIVGMTLAPHTGPDVAAKGQALAEKFRAAGAPVVLVRVAFAPDFSDAVSPPVDAPAGHPPGGFPANWSTLMPGLQAPGDILIVKRQWGAFYGTELDLQLRRRGVKTIVLAGIATNMGVESTARGAWEHGYALVIAEDGCTGFATDLHDMAMQRIFPMIARVTASAGIGFSG